MRMVTYGGAVSLDGFLAGENGSMDWLDFSKDVRQIMAGYWKDVDTILMGRKSYEVWMWTPFSWGARATRCPCPRAARRAQEKRPRRRSRKRSQFALTSSREHSSRSMSATLSLSKRDVVEFRRKLNRGAGKGICLMGGGELAQTLLAAGLVDRIGLNVHPILLGSGIPTFRDPGHHVKMSLTECRRLEGGCVLMDYEVIRVQ
jgi:dihydrofolate reductase